MSERIGVYVCRCGGNISEKIDIKTVTSFALGQPDVVVAGNNVFMCSSRGQELIHREISEKNLTRIVVAACSPHLHEVTFATVCARAGLNPYLFEMANIREQDAWSTSDSKAATEKAKALVAAAISRVRHQIPLQKVRVEMTPAALVIGGGIAGITAALEIANSGKRVYLIERESSLGGHMAQLDRMFPTLDCSDCLLTPKMAAAGMHPNISLFTYSEVEEVKGFIGNFEVKIRKKARYIDEARCIQCGICQQKCPETFVDSGFEAGMGCRKACSIPFVEAVPKYPVINKERCLYFKTGGCRICALECPTGAIDFAQADEMVTIKAGAVILATGYDLFDAQQVPQYGYGRYANVFTSLEFERMLNTAGPTGGKVVLRDGRTVPRSVGIIHCVGSRDKNYREYCSRICCMYSLKFAHFIKERTEAQVYNFYVDMRAGGKAYEEFYQKLLEDGVNFIRGRAAAVMDTAFTPAEEGKLVVQTEDTLLGIQRRVPVDMVILSPAMEAGKGSKKTAKLFGLECTAGGFFSEKHAKLEPVGTLKEGVFIAGTCQGPKDINDTITQSGAAAARVMSLINKPFVELEPFMAHVEREKCSGCRICTSICPYGAIHFNEEDNTAEVNQALCQGCGTCVAACPSQAIYGSHFTDQQIMAEIEGVLYDKRDSR